MPRAGSLYVRHCVRSCAAYTLVELLVVVAILAVAAVVALPSAQPVAEFRADTAAAEVAHALRYARENAVYSGAQRLFSCDAAANTFAVVALDSGAPSTTISKTVLSHPFNQAPYQMSLNAAPAGNTMSLVSCTFTFADNGSAPALGFDASGSPIRAMGSSPARESALRTGRVILGSGNVVRTVDIDAAGRITVS